MNKLAFTFAMPTMLALFLVARPSAAQPLQPAELSAGDVLQKSIRTYAGFDTYKGTCSVVTDTVISVGDEAPKQEVASAMASIEFVRGKYMTVQGTDSGGAPFKAYWSPGETWLETTRRRGEGNGEYKREIITQKDDSNLTPQVALLAGLSGFTQGVGSSIPGALMTTEGDWYTVFEVLDTDEAKFLPVESLGAVPCYIIEVTSPKLNRVTTFWIERDSFLLRRLTQEMGETIYDDMPPVDGKKEPVMRVAYTLHQYVFATSEAK